MTAALIPREMHCLDAIARRAVRADGARAQLAAEAGARGDKLTAYCYRRKAGEANGDSSS